MIVFAPAHESSKLSASAPQVNCLKRFHSPLPFPEVIDYTQAKHCLMFWSSQATSLCNFANSFQCYLYKYVVFVHLELE